MTFFDTHIHLYDERYDGDRPDVLERMRGAGVVAAVCVGTDIPSSRQSVALAEQCDGIYCAVGVHPHEASSWNSGCEGELAALISHPNAVALGETGLDYHYDFSPRAVQRSAFEQQLSLAIRLNAPAVIHVREAHSDAYEILRAYHGLRGVMHCFSGSWEMASRYLDLGFYISFAGPLTFNNAAKLPDVAARIPLSRALVETDGPYLAPVPHRGKRNEPAFVSHTALRFAQLRGEPQEEVLQALVQNAMNFFEIASADAKENA